MQSPNLKLLLLLVPIFAALAISGCTGGGSTISTGPGIQILSWAPSLSTVDSGDSLQLRLKIQNQGDSMAENVNAFITGIDPDEWILSVPSGRVWGVGTTDAQIILHLDELLGPDKSQSIGGATAEQEIDLTAPVEFQGTSLTYTPQVRVYYSYTTKASNQVTVVNDQELKRLQDQGKTLASGTTTQSAGPLTVTVNTGKFLKARQVGASRIFQITVDIQNTGSGVVSPNKGGNGYSDQDYEVYFEIPLQSNRLDITCPTLSGDTLYGEGTTAGHIKLFQGKSTSVTCQVTIESTPLASEQVAIPVVLSYDYYIDSSTSITVYGQ